MGGEVTPRGVHPTNPRSPLLTLVLAHAAVHLVFGLESCSYYYYAAAAPLMLGLGIPCRFVPCCASPILTVRRNSFCVVRRAQHMAG
jgi:hypothetical protein